MPLESWNGESAKETSADFVVRLAKNGVQEFVPPGERIATFDDDAPWCEQPLQAPVLFLADPVEQIAGRNRGAIFGSVVQ